MTKYYIVGNPETKVLADCANCGKEVCLSHTIWNEEKQYYENLISEHDMDNCVWCGINFVEFGHIMKMKGDNNVQQS